LRASGLEPQGGFDDKAQGNALGKRGPRSPTLEGLNNSSHRRWQVGSIQPRWGWAWRRACTQGVALGFVMEPPLGFGGATSGRPCKAVSVVVPEPSFLVRRTTASSPGFQPGVASSRTVTHESQPQDPHPTPILPKNAPVTAVTPDSYLPTRTVTAVGPRSATETRAVTAISPHFATKTGAVTAVSPRSDARARAVMAVTAASVSLNGDVTSRTASVPPSPARRP
jgi:hypothetical protein